VMLLYPVLYGTLTIAFSSFGSMVMSLMLTATLYSFTFIGDTIIHIIAEITQNESLRKLEVLSDWLIPHGRLATWFGSLEQGMVPAMRREMGRRAGEHLTYTSFDQFYIFAYIIGFLLLANIVFSRRDLN
jgi:ABC-type transport system involved in multi-copper enzyme maturation permease subunit